MTLTQRIEAAAEPSADLFREAWEKSQPVSRDPDRFLTLIDNEAWLDAAKMFVPKGKVWVRGAIKRRGSNEALDLLSACLKARGIE